MLAAVVIKIAARVLCQRMHQKDALEVARLRRALERVEVLTRVFVVPRGTAGRERHQPDWRRARMARDATRVAGTLRKKDRLHLHLEVLEIQGSGRSGLLTHETSQQQRPGRNAY